MRRAVFLDRDGVLNRKAPEGEYITRWEDVEFLPGVIEAVRGLNQAGYLVILTTNQRGVAKNMLTEAELQEIHERVPESVRRERIAHHGCLLLPARDRRTVHVPKAETGHAASRRRRAFRRSRRFLDGRR
jgi:D-glycero-D-manno-heptose 1,7-bisphosphate phosphatase